MKIPKLLTKKLNPPTYLVIILIVLAIFAVIGKLTTYKQCEQVAHRCTTTYCSDEDMLHLKVCRQVYGDEI